MAKKRGKLVRSDEGNTKKKEFKDSSAREKKSPEEGKNKGGENQKRDRGAGSNPKKTCLDNAS